LKRLESPRIVRCYGCFIGKEAGLVVELMEISIHKRYIRQDGADLSWKTAYQICLDIALGLKFLHERKPNYFIHGDLKSDNILLDKDNRAKLSDFGSSKLKYEAQNNSTQYTILGKNTGTANMLAPELVKELIISNNLVTGLSDKAKTSKESDIYSFGLVLIELTTRRVPFSDYFKKGSPPENFKKDHAQKELQEKHNADTPGGLLKVIKSCTKKEPTERIKISECVTILENELIIDNIPSKNIAWWTQ